MHYVTYRPGTTPLVLDSPHSGVIYLDDFAYACDLATLRTAEDTHVEIVLSKVRLGKGLIWRATDDGVPIYNCNLSVAEVRSRIANCWQPYHAAVTQAIDAAHTRHGYSIHINCHSMPAVGTSHATDFPGLVHALLKTAPGTVQRRRPSSRL